MSRNNFGYSVGQEQSSFSVTNSEGQQRQTNHAMQQEVQYQTTQRYEMNEQSAGYNAHTMGQQSLAEVDLESRYNTGVQQQNMTHNRFGDSLDARQLQLESDAAYRNGTNSGFNVQYGDQQTVSQLEYRGNVGTVMSKQDYENKRNVSSQQRGQFASSWRNAGSSGFSAGYQNRSQSVQVEKAETDLTVMSEDEYRHWLTVNFKHRFDPYEAQSGLPINEFQIMVNSSDLRRTENLNGLFKKLDKDKNNRVSWQEFFQGMKYTKKDEASKARRFINSFVNGTTPVAKKKIRKQRERAADIGEPIPEESYLEAYNCRPPPLFIPLFYIIVWIIFIIYAVELEKGPVWNRVSWDKGFPFQSPLVFCTSVRQQVWRFLSYCLLHSGYSHIIFNTLLSLLLGLPLECVHKAWRVGPVFMIGVLFGSLASAIADPTTPLVGASGGVYALIGAHYALIIMNWEELQDDWVNVRKNPLRFLLSGVMRLVYLTALVMVDFGLAFFRRYSGTTLLPTSIVAHLAGLFAGLFSGVPILRNIEKKPWEGIAFIVSIVICVVLFLIGVIWNIFGTGYPAPEEASCSNPSLLLRTTGK